jgi:hypothetical protein
LRGEGEEETIKAMTNCVIPPSFTKNGWLPWSRPTQAPLDENFEVAQHFAVSWNVEEKNLYDFHPKYLFCSSSSSSIHIPHIALTNQYSRAITFRFSVTMRRLVRSFPKLGQNPQVQCRRIENTLIECKSS